MRFLEENKMYRVEKKYLCSDYQMLLMKQRLAAILPMDSHQIRESYIVRSLYLDTYEDICFYENEDGVDNRKKYRIRIYPESDKKISFEIKNKKNQKCKKEIFSISRAECEKILRNKYEFGIGEELRESKCNQPTRNQAMFLMQTALLHPTVIIEYERSAFVYPVGNVRITFDRNIIASPDTENFFEGDFLRIPVLPTNIHILEVKYDELLPDFIAQVLDIGTLRTVTFSKYYICRQVAERKKKL